MTATSTWWATAPPDDIRSWAEEITARPEFQPPAPSLLERVGDAVERAIDWVLGGLGSLGGGGIYGLVAWILVGAAAALLVYGAMRLAAGWDLRRGPRRAIAVTVTEQATTAGTAGDWAGRAEEAERTGDLDLAVRCWWRALVADLDSGGALDERPAGTAAEYRQVLAERAAGQRERFDRSTGVFEPVWYGGRRARPQDVAAARRAAEQRVSLR